MRSYIYIGMFLFVIAAINVGHCMIYWFEHDTFSSIKLLKHKYGIFLFALLCLIVGNYFMRRWAKTHKENN